MSNPAVDLSTDPFLAAGISPTINLSPVAPSTHDDERDAIERSIFPHRETSDSFDVAQLAKVVPVALTLSARIGTAARESSAAFDAGLAESRPLRFALENAAHERTATDKLLQHMDEIRDGMRNGLVGMQGAQVAKGNAEADFQKTLGKIDANWDKWTADFLAENRASRLPAATADTAGAVAVATSIFDRARAEKFLEHVAGVLERATDPAESPAEQTRANQLLEALIPLLDRRANSPEKHAEHLRAAHGDLLYLAEQHLGTLLGRVQNTKAREIIDTLTTQRAWVRGTVAQQGKWEDDVLGIMAPLLFAAIGKRKP